MLKRAGAVEDSKTGVGGFGSAEILLYRLKWSWFVTGLNPGFKSFRDLRLFPGLSPPTKRTAFSEITEDKMLEE
ncbi:hypothetical protein MSMTP_1702 [Methanosarcina sp. MTP4]|nr:hypothetical protein MSMTP_1702 [Methanosarcina sp. MTP4]